MIFIQTLANLDTGYNFEHLASELRSYVYVMDFGSLTRCGGQISNADLIQIENVSITDVELIVLFRIEFDDGAALDCSGHCGGKVTRRTDVLKLKISRTAGRATWETLDGVISGSY